MFFKQHPTKESSLSYFVGCAGHAIGAAVDVVAGDEDWFIEQAAQANMRIAYVIDTHVPADHFSGGRNLAKRVGAPYCLHESARSFMKFDYEPLVDGQMLDLGNVKIKVLHTPGHTIDSMCLLVSDPRRGPEPWFVITGYTLFVGATGRPDLAGRKQEMVGMRFDSMDAKLLNLPVDLEIFPGHQAGSACGVAFRANPLRPLALRNAEAVAGHRPRLLCSRTDHQLSRAPSQHGPDRRFQHHGQIRLWS